MEFVRAKSNGLRSVRVLYFLLFLWALISVGYYVAGSIALREEFFGWPS